MRKPKAFKDDICVCCGEYVPEGRQVCHTCEKDTKNKLKVSEGLLLGVDIGSGDDISVLQVVRYVNGKREVINTLYGEDAEFTYEHLINNQHHKVRLDGVLASIKAKKGEKQ